jgi:hypothetical protein
MTDVWDQMSETVPDESQGNTTEDLPAKVWALGTTCTEKDGGWKPRIAKFDTKNGTLYKLEVSYNTLGGEADKVDPKKHRYARTPHSVFIHDKNDRDRPAPQLVGLLNSLFSAGIGAGEDKEVAKRQRWANTVQTLREVADLYGYTPEQTDDDIPKFIAMCAVEKLKEESFQLLIKPTTRQYKKKDGSQGEQTQVSQFEDATEENIQARKIVTFETEEDDMNF